jgi:hypothetical protein
MVGCLTQGNSNPATQFSETPRFQAFHPIVVLLMGHSSYSGGTRKITSFVFLRLESELSHGGGCSEIR